MKTLKLLMPRMEGRNPILAPLLVLAIGILLWQSLPLVLSTFNPTVGLVDAGIWQLLLFSILCYLIFLLMSVMLFNWLLVSLALPTINNMVSQFNTLTSWQQLRFYWASFALLLFTSVGCFIAVL